MVDSNLQREHILPSERAKAYKMKMEAMRGRVGRPMKNNECPMGTNYYSADEVAKEADESPRQIFRYNHWLEEGEQITIDLTKGQTFSGFFSFSIFFGSMVSSGSIWIIVGIAVALAAAAVITVIVVKKRKKNAG